MRALLFGLTLFAFGCDDTKSQTAVDAPLTSMPDAPKPSIDAPVSTIDAPVSTIDAPTVVIDAATVDDASTVDASTVDAAPVDPAITSACAAACTKLFACFMEPVDPDCNVACAEDLGDCTAQQVQDVAACAALECGDPVETGPVFSCLTAITCISQ